MNLKERILNKVIDIISVLRLPLIYFVRLIINARLKRKIIKGEKINVIFVCHRPAVWESQKSIYEALRNDDFFDVRIVAIPNKKDWPQKHFNHNYYESEGAEEFWKDYDCINGYNYNSHKWLNIRKLKPDYVFFQQPYNQTRYFTYKSWYVALFAKVCFVPYGFQIIGDDVFKSVHPQNFMNSLSYYFCIDTFNYNDIKKWFKIIKNFGLTKTIISGFPRFDSYFDDLPNDPDLWNYKGKDKRFRIIWTPRWCTNEDTCTFFEYRAYMIQYAKEHSDVEIVFRPHPQAFNEWDKTGEMTRKEQVTFRQECKDAGIVIDENGSYIEQFKTTDCFITDITSLMGEYLVTGKPIIYCYKKDYFTEIGRKLSEGYYKTEKWQEVENVLSMLQSGNDPLKEKRDELVHRYLVTTDNKIGKDIAEIIKNDAKNSNR